MSPDSTDSPSGKSAGTEGAADEAETDLPSVRAAGDKAAFRVFGARRDHARATELAEHAHRMLFRYTNEVVAAHQLCPFLHGAESGLGAIGVVLDVEPDVESAYAALDALGEAVVHLVFPIFAGTAAQFERFGSKLAETVRARRRDPLVHATFHPDLTGGRENAYRLIGLLRQAPDPFVQFVPPGLQKGGTVLAGEQPEEGHAEARFARLMSGGGAAADTLLEIGTRLREERARLYGDLAKLVAAGS